MADRGYYPHTRDNGSTVHSKSLYCKSIKGLLLFFGMGNYVVDGITDRRDFFSVLVGNLN